MMILIRLRFLFVLALLTACSGAARADFYAFFDGDQLMVLISDTPPADPRYLLYKKERIGEPEEAAEEEASPQLDDRPLAPSKFSSHILAAAKETRVDPALIQAVILVESGYNPAARSSAGAVGLMQLMPETARRYGVKDRLDPAQNIHGGARYLRDLKLLFQDDLQLVLAAYNAGEEAVMKYGRRIPPYRETTAYVPKVLNHYRKYRPAGM